MHQDLLNLLDKPHTKLFREERDRSIYVLLDLSAGMFFGSRGQLKARLATLLAASASWQALEQGDKVKHQVFGEGVVMEVDGDNVAVHFKTKEPIVVPAHRTVRIRISKELKEQLNNGTVD